MTTSNRDFWGRGAAAVLFGLALGWHASAVAGAGSTHTVVRPVSATVTYNEPGRQITHVGYEIQIRNDSRNTINDVRFIAQLSATRANLQTIEAATVEGLAASACVLTAASVDCRIGQLRSGARAPVFAIFFRAPEQPAAGSGAVDQVVLSGATVFAEQFRGGPKSPRNSSESQPWPPSAVSLGTPTTDSVKSALTKSGGSFQTAVGDTDPITTVVVAPGDFTVSLPGGGTTTYTSVELSESALSLQTDPNCNNFWVCQQSLISIPGATFSPYLRIVLRMAAWNIKTCASPGGATPCSQIGSVIIDYVADDGALVPNIGDCASPTMPNPLGVPCIASRKHYNHPSVPGWTPALSGSFEWTLLNLGNGSYKLF